MPGQPTKVEVVKTRIASWLAMTQDSNLTLGLSETEVERAATELYRGILAGEVSPHSFVLIEETKQILSVVIRQLGESAENGELKLRRSDAIYEFIYKLDWPNDEFGEQQDLLTECAEFGYRAAGKSLAEIGQRRLSASVSGSIYGFGNRSSRSAGGSRLPSPCAATCELSVDLGLSPDVLLDVFEELREKGNFSPSTAALQAERLYFLIDSCPDRVGIFDEKDYFLGSAALIAGGANRLLGRRDTAEIWLDRAEAAFRHTVNPGPSLAAVTYARLAVLYDARSYSRVLEQTPMLLTSLARFGMKRELLKTRFLESLTLKEMGRTDQALTNILSLASDPDLTVVPQLSPVVSVQAAELLSEQRRYAEAEQCCENALRSESANQPLVMGHLKGISAVALREQGRLDEAAESFRAAIHDYASAEMNTQVAYMRVVLAETLLLLSRYREAEWEILAALPTIEEQKMVPEGFAAVALLKESVRRRKTDPNALRELREHLQASR